MIEKTELDTEVPLWRRLSPLTIAICEMAIKEGLFKEDVKDGQTSNNTV